MAEKQDIREDQMNLVSGVDYVRGLRGNDSVLIALNNLFANYGIVRENKSLMLEKKRKSTLKMAV